MVWPCSLTVLSFGFFGDLAVNYWLFKLVCLSGILIPLKAHFQCIHLQLFALICIFGDRIQILLPKLLGASMRSRSSRFMVSRCEIFRNSYKTPVLTLARMIDCEERIRCDSVPPSSAILNMYYPCLLSFFSYLGSHYMDGRFQHAMQSIVFFKLELSSNAFLIRM